jgi:hypothetical protein
VVNEKGREVAKAGDPYVDKKGKACQEKFYLIMKECSVNEYRHQYESGRNELGSLIEKEAYECYNEMHEWETTDGARRDGEMRKRERLEKAGQAVQALALGQVIRALERKKEQQLDHDEDVGGKENDEGGEDVDEDEDEEGEEKEEGGKEPKRNKRKPEFRPRKCAGRIALLQSLAGRREIEALVCKQEKEKEEMDRKREENWIAHQAFMKQVADDAAEEKKRREREIDMMEEENRLRRSEMREMRETRNAEMELRKQELAVRKQEAENMHRLLEYLSGKKYHNE